MQAKVVSVPCLLPAVLADFKERKERRKRCVSATAFLYEPVLCRPYILQSTFANSYTLKTVHVTKSRSEAQWLRFTIKDTSLEAV